jgi:hypothetical protein
MRTTFWENLVQQADITADDSDKTFTVPAAKQWWLKSLYASLISTAVVGNRQLDVLITDGDDNPVCKAVAGAVQAASLTREYVFAPGNPQETGFTNGLMYRAIPDRLVLPAGYKIRVYDSAAIDPTHDDLTLRLLVEERTE